MSEGRRRGVAVAALILVASVAVPSAHAQTDMSPEALRQLAERARTDRTALERLRTVRSVGGQPARLDRALDGAEGEELTARLDALSGRAGGQGVGTDADQARRQATDVLDGRRFQPRDEPRPLRGFFRWLGERVEPLEGPLRPILEPLAAAWTALTAGGFWSLLVGALVTVAAAVLSLRLVRRRARGGAVGGGWTRARGDGLDAGQLERRADEAERAGQLAEAVRLRFLAGLVRLDAQGRVALRPSLTAGELRRAVPTAPVRELTATFEEIAYGGRPAGPGDVEQARREWPRVLTGSGTR